MKNKIDNLGLVLLELGEYNDAIMMFNLALEIDPNKAEVYKNKGEKYKLIFRKCTQVLIIV